MISLLYEFGRSLCSCPDYKFTKFKGMCGFNSGKHADLTSILESIAYYMKTLTPTRIFRALPVRVLPISKLKNILPELHGSTSLFLKNPSQWNCKIGFCCTSFLLFVQCPTTDYFCVCLYGAIRMVVGPIKWPSSQQRNNLHSFWPDDTEAKNSISEDYTLLAALCLEERSFDKLMFKSLLPLGSNHS